MRDLVKNFPEQLTKALQIAETASISNDGNFQSVLVSGLGGSGIGGTLLAELTANDSKLPIFVNKDYTLPAWVNESVLVIISSYSGNTEETVSVMERALKAKAKIVCVTSGGKILELAKQHQLECIEIPGGMPPRSCLGYSLVQLIKILIAKEIIPTRFLNEIKASAELLIEKTQIIQAHSKSIAQQLVGKIPVIYALGNCEGVAVRFRQQINENSKMLCWHHVFPEMNHNELVGWTEPHPDKVVVSFSTTFTNPRTLKRYDICKTVFSKYANNIIDIKPEGKSLTEQFFYLVHLGDWISVDVAHIKQIDAVEVNVINHLKDELAKF
jgi:glucose/mannose-6-phosphate isomerase